MNIDILEQNINYWVINKPAGLSVHPGAGDQITLTQIWADKYHDWKNLDWPDSNRPGIVHRLDKDTSGIMLIAKNPESLIQLSELFSTRNIKKQYLTLCIGIIKEKEFNVEASVSRDLSNRQKQTSSILDLPWHQKSKDALTKFKILEEFIIENQSIYELLCCPETGRMHQIRVHLKLKNLPIIGDSKYANKISKKFNRKFQINRQMLHAYILNFKDPWTKQQKEFKANLPSDFEKLLKMLRHPQ